MPVWVSPVRKPLPARHSSKNLQLEGYVEIPPPPPRPHVSHEGINLMQQQPCEPEDRLGSQSTTSVFRPNTRAIHARRSGFLSPPLHAGDGAEGASLTQRYWLGKYSQIPCPYRPELSNPEDTRHVDSEIPPEIHFCETESTVKKNLNVRKALAFAGFTKRAPRDRLHPC